MALIEKPAVVYTIRILVTCSVFLGVILLSGIGGILNRCRGGFAPLEHIMGYWPAHDLSRELFSLVTGILVLVVGCHIRAGIIVWLLTQWSLFVGWGTYMNIGMVPGNYLSRSGVFDWLVGRQEMEWNYTQRFVREFSGMTLRGFVWTAPQGYALQLLGFGWQYSLSGSLMGLVYYTGSCINTNHHHNKFFDSTIAYSEFFWGSWIWFVLLISCITQLVYRIRRWIYCRSISSVRSPHTRFNQFMYESLSYTVTKVTYNLFMFILWLVFAASIVFYSLIIQPDIRNKGQTFFGLFMSLLSLTFFGAWHWGSLYTQRQVRKAKEVAEVQMNHFQDRRGPLRGCPSPQFNDFDRLEGGRVVGYGIRAETDPLLPWPYSHPDKGFADRRKSPVAMYDSRSSTPSNYGSYGTPLSSGLTSNGPPHHRRKSLSSVSIAFILVWPSLEKWVWFDFFSFIQHVIGLISLFATILTVFMCSIAFVMDLSSPRFNPQYFVCNNTES